MHSSLSTQGPPQTSNPLEGHDTPLLAWLLALLLALLLGILLGYFTLQHLAVETVLAKVPTRDNLTAASRFAPESSEVEASLGRLFQYTPTDFDLNQAVQHYRRALELNPYDAFVWLDLSRAEESLGEWQQAQRTLRNAAIAFPSSAPVHWTYANFLVRNSSFFTSPASTQGASTPNGGTPRLTKESANTGFSELLVQLRHAVELDSSSLSAAIDLAAHAGVDAEAIYKTMVPPNPAIEWMALNQFVARGEFGAASLAWEAVSTSIPPVTAEQMLWYVNALIQRNRIDEARKVWARGLEIIHYKGQTTAFGAGNNAAGNLIFNANFNSDPLNGGFDWRVENSRDARLSLDTHVAPPGQPGPSLRIDFSGRENLNFGNVFQFVPVKPATFYTLTAWMKSSELTTDQGLFLEIIDTKESGNFARTEMLKGTTEWAQLHAQFHTGPATDLSMVRIRRMPTWKFDYAIKGTAWISQVRLVKKVE